MRPWFPRLVILLLPLLASATSRGAPLNFDLRGYDRPSVLPGVNQPRACTVTYLVADFVADETYAARMRFTPAPGAVPVNGRMACPSLVPPLVAETALDLCRQHAEKPADCVFADMDHGFPDAPGLARTAEAASRCASDQASQIAVACASHAGGPDLCNVGCGEDQDAAIAAARRRCEATHRTACTITGALPVAAP